MIEDIKIIHLKSNAQQLGNYQAHPHIKAPLSN